MQAKLEVLIRKLHSKQQRSTQCMDQEMRCPFCGSTNIVYDWQRGEYICRNCGTVVQERVVDISRPEYRIFDFEDRVLEHYEYADPVDGPGCTFVSERRIGKLQVRLKSRRSERVRRFVESLAYRYNIPRHVVDEFLILYKTVRDLPCRRPYMLALLHLLVRKHCLQLEIPAKPRYVLRVKEILAKHGITINYCGDRPVRQLLDKALNFLRPVLVLRDDTKIMIMRKTLKLYENARRVVTGRKTAVLLAACLYIMLNLSGHRITQRHVATAFGVSDVALRSCYREILSKIKITVEV